MQRCKWKNLDKSEIYQMYHDSEWGIESHEERYLFEMLILESFHCGLSWLIILKKRGAFKKAFSQFDVNAVSKYDENDVQRLMQNTDIVRNKAKILATIENAKSFIKIQKEFGSFDSYIWSFTNGEVVFSNTDELIARNELSDMVAKDLKKRGFKFMGSVTTYSYLEAIGVMNNHASFCFKSAHTAR